MPRDNSRHGDGSHARGRNRRYIQQIMLIVGFAGSEFSIVASFGVAASSCINSKNRVRYLGNR